MCEFVADHVDMKTMSESQKKKLRSALGASQGTAPKGVKALEETIKKIK